MSETAFADDIKQLGESIVGLTLKQAKELSDYLKEVHGIEAAAGGAVMMAAPSDGPAAAAPVEQTEFDVILTSFGENKLNVVKVVKNLTGASLMDSKKLVESCPAKIKEGTRRKTQLKSRRNWKKLVLLSS